MSPLRRDVTPVPSAEVVGRTAASTIAGACLLAAACLLLVLAGSAGAATRPKPTREHGRGHWFRPTCAAPLRGAASCNALVVTNAAGAPLAAGAPAAGALAPAKLARAYALPVSSTASATIAIVDAYDDPNIEADLATYSAYYGLPACTTSNGCFRKVNQTGGTSYPSRSTSWGQEISLDVEIARGICQSCKILLVEATTPTYANLGAAENEAVALGATVISNSWGGSEGSSETTYDQQYFTHPGVLITASTGDSGYGTQYPAASPSIVAVGGTTLTLNADGSYRSEKAWSKGGSGCSAYEPRPSWQTAAGCSKRSVADLAADADPNTGAAIYDSYGASGWLQMGGTSLAAPLIAAVYALSGNTTDPAAPYASPSSLHDVTSGTNGSCSPASLCAAGVGYDGPTGLGTPNGLAAFGGAPAPAASPDYALSLSPASQSVTQGQGASYLVTMTPNATFANSDAVAVTPASLPADVLISGCSAALTTASPTCTLTVATSGASAASHALTVTGAGPGLPGRSAGATLGVTAPLAPDYALSVSPPSQSVTQGATASYTVTMTPNASFPSGGSVAVSGSSTPADAAFSGCAAALTADSPSCTLTVATASASAVSHGLNVSGAGSPAGLPNRTAAATLLVTAPLAPDYGLSMTPTSQSVTQGQPASYTVTMTPNATFGSSASVAVAAGSVPSDITATGCSAPLTASAPTCTLSVATTGASATSHALTITGTGSSGLSSRSATATLLVQAVAVGDFSLSISPTSRFAFTPTTTSYTVTISRQNGFAGDVALAVSGLPATFTWSFSVASTTGTTATLTITAPRTSFSTIHVTVSGTSGGLVRTAATSLTVF